MADAPRKSIARAVIGASSAYAHQHQLRADEFIPELRGAYAIRKYREMRDNDPLIGGLLMAIEMLIRSADLTFEPPEDSGAAGDDAAEFMDGVMTDMDGSLDDFLAEALSFLPFGFALFEVIYKTRRGPDAGNRADRSMFSDGAWGIRRLASRPQWTIERFVYDEDDEITGVRQFATVGLRTVQEIPIEKLAHFRTTTLNDDPAGRSVLRNAYTSYHYATHIEMIEAIAVEREMNGIPVMHIPSEALDPDATGANLALRNAAEKIVRDVKFNDQGGLVLPSDPYITDDGKPSNVRQVELSLLSASGTRAIPTGDVVKRHQQNIARSVLADFLTLGQSERGSFALSKSKTDLFLAAAEGFTEAMASTITRQIVKPLWRLNGFGMDLMPTAKFGKIAPEDLAEFGAFLRDAAAAGVVMAGDEETDRVIRERVDLPEREADPDMMGAEVGEDPDGEPEDGDAT